MRYVFVTERVAYELPEKYDVSNPNTVMELLENEELEEAQAIRGWIWDIHEVEHPDDVHEALEDWDGKHHPKG